MSDRPSREVALFQNRKLCGISAIIDEDDLDLIAGRNWSLFVPHRSRTRYARSGPLYLHKLIMGAPPEDGLEVDHLDGDGLNNRRSNLRWLTHQKNVEAAAAMHSENRMAKSSYVHTVKMRGRTYFYDRRTRQTITPNRLVSVSQMRRSSRV